MTYVGGRIVNDADAHTMETQDWLAPYLEGEYKEKYSQVYSRGEGGERIVKMIDAAKARKSNPEERAKVAANPIEGPKGWLGYGGFDKEERVEALDWLGFNSQLVFPTFGLAAITRAKSEDQAYAAARALNLAQIDFCDADERLVAVAFCPLDDPKRALEEAKFAVGKGAGAVMFSAEAAGGRSPGHPDLDPFWQYLQDNRIPFQLHIGPGTKRQPEGYMNNGRERSPDLHGGGENLRFPGRRYDWQAAHSCCMRMRNPWHHRGSRADAAFARARRRGCGARLAVGRLLQRREYLPRHSLCSTAGRTAALETAAARSRLARNPYRNRERACLRATRRSRSLGSELRRRARRAVRGLPLSHAFRTRECQGRTSGGVAPRRRLFPRRGQPRLL